MNHLIYHRLVYYHLILVYHHQALLYHHLSILALMEKLKRRRRIENLLGYGVVHLAGDVNGLAKKLHLLAADFFEGNTSNCFMYWMRFLN